MPATIQRLAPILALGALTLGCAHYQPRPLSAVESAGALDSRRLDDEAMRRVLVEAGERCSSWPLARWTPEQLVLAAYYFHPDLDLARSASALAEAARISAGERPEPTLAVSPQRSVTDRVPSPWVLAGSLEATLEPRGKRALRKMEAANLADAARLRVASTAWRVRAGVHRALVELRNAQQSADAWRAMVALREQRIEILEAQLEAGAVSTYELTQARLGAQQSALELQRSELRVSVARADLAQAVGVPLVAIEELQFSFEGLDRLPDQAALADLRNQTLRDHSDLLAALAEFSAADTAYRLELARQYPDLRLGPSFELDQGNRKWGLLLGLTVPVLNRNRGPIAEALERRAVAASRFETLQATLLGQLDRAIAGYRSARAALDRTNGLVEKLKGQERRAELMLRGGEISRAELIELQLQQAAINLTRLEWIARLRVAVDELESLLQGPIGLPETLWKMPTRQSADRSPEGVR